jgi:ATP-dependent DNA helicase RecQ
VAGSAVVYVRNRERTKEISGALVKHGISSDFFHAGLNREVKNQRQDKWKSGQCRVMVATNAFGMGIDKPDVRLVAHIDMPGSLEEYYQEAGRAGRDGLKAYAVALVADSDRATLLRRASAEYPEKDFIKRVYDALGNYMQIAVGFGLDSIRDFAIDSFCAAFKLPILQTHHALKILELAGYIEYIEDSENASRLMFTTDRDDLYKELGNDNLTNLVAQTILRMYTGLFADYAYINEGVIAAKTGCTPVQIYDTLVGLSKRRIISYIPRKRTPLIIYTRSREDVKYVQLPKAVYENRKQRFDKRLAKVIEYRVRHHVGGVETRQKSQLIGQCAVR